MATLAFGLSLGLIGLIVSVIAWSVESHGAQLYQGGGELSTQKPRTAL